MQHTDTHIDTHIERKNLASQLRLLDRLIYLPGAAVILYGLWLALSV
jgi:hypothetical protein